MSCYGDYEAGEQKDKLDRGNDNASHLTNLSYSRWIKPEAKLTKNWRMLSRSSLFTTIGTIYWL